MRTLVVLSAALSVWALVGSAEELGQITVFLDGEERVWHTITMEQGGEPVATATLDQSGHAVELQVQGHPIAAFTSKGTLSVDVRFKDRYLVGTEAQSVEILYTPNGLSGPLWTSRNAPTPARIQIVDFDLWGKVGQVVAVFSGEICLRPRLFSRTDTSDCKQLNGKIETRLVAK